MRFIAHDTDGNPLITDQTESIRLYFRSGNKEHALIWRFKEEPPQPPIIPHPRGLKKKENSAQTSVQPRKRIRK